MSHLWGHLGANVSAVVDGELDHDGRDRALAHVMRCPVCRADVDTARATKALLSRLEEPMPSRALLESLLSLPGPLGPIPPERQGAGSRPTTAAWRPVSNAPGGAARGSRRPGAGPARTDRTGVGRRDGVSHRVQLFAAGAFSAVAVTLGLAALGTEQAPRQAPTTVVPPVADFTVEHARSTSQLPYTGRTSVFEPVGGSTTFYTVSGTSRP